MPTISFASSKGGAGKSTSAVLLATELAQHGTTVTIIDAVKVIQFIGRQERAYNRKIPFAVLFTQTNPAVRPRTLKSLEADMLKQGIPVLGTALHERDAYRAIFSFGGTLSALKQDLVGNIPSAIRNTREFT